MLPKKSLRDERIPEPAFIVIKKSQDISVNPGIQFPDIITSLNSNTIIRKANALVKQINKDNIKN